MFVGCLWSPFLTHPQLVQMALLRHEDSACAVFPIMVSPLSPCRAAASSCCQSPLHLLLACLCTLSLPQVNTLLFCMCHATVRRQRQRPTNFACQHSTYSCIRSTFSSLDTKVNIFFIGTYPAFSKKGDSCACCSCFQYVHACQLRCKCANTTHMSTLTCTALHHEPNFILYQQSWFYYVYRLATVLRSAAQCILGCCVWTTPSEVTSQTRLAFILQVQTIHPYSASTQSTVMTLAKDNVYSSDTETDAVRQILSYSEVVSGDASAGLIATIDAIVDTSASYTDTVTAENDTSTTSTSSSSSSWASQHVAATVLIVLVCVGAAAGAGLVVYKRYVARWQPYTLYDTNVQMSST